MRLCTKLSARKLTIAGGLLSCILGFGGRALAQTAQPKAPASRRSSGGGGRTAVAAAAKLDCDLLADAARSRVSRRPVTLSENRRDSVSFPLPCGCRPTPRSRSCLMQLPLGVYLPAGATLADRHARSQDASVHKLRPGWLHRGIRGHRCASSMPLPKAQTSTSRPRASRGSRSL